LAQETISQAKSAQTRTVPEELGGEVDKSEEVPFILREGGIRNTEGGLAD